MIKATDIVNTIEFINSIKNYECVWNIKIPNRDQKYEIRAAWTSIAKKYHLPAGLLRERWRNIRNTFERSMKTSTLKGVPGGNKRKEYYLTEYLQFLIPHIRSNSEIDNNTSSSWDGQTEVTTISSDDDDNNDEWWFESGMKSNFEVEEHSTMPIIQQQQTQRLQQTNVQIQSPTAVQENQLQSQQNLLKPFVENSFLEDDKTTTKRKRLDYEEQEESRSISIINPDKVREQEDANLYFLKSLLPDLNCMNSIQNRRFRRKVIILMDDILNDTDLIQQHQNNDISATSTSQSNYTIQANTLPIISQVSGGNDIKTELFDLNLKL